MQGLDRYPSEVKAIADELLELLRTEQVSREARHIIDTQGDKALVRMNAEDRRLAENLLTQTPSQRTRTLKKLSQSEKALAILRARFMGLVAANVLEFADRFEMVPGMSYRRAAGFAATEAIRVTLTPTTDEVMPEW